MPLQRPYPSPALVPLQKRGEGPGCTVNCQRHAFLHPDCKGDIVFAQEFQPFSPDERAIREQELDRTRSKQVEIALPGLPVRAVQGQARDDLLRQAFKLEEPLQPTIV